MVADKGFEPLAQAYEACELPAYSNRLWGSARELNPRSATESQCFYSDYGPKNLNTRKDKGHRDKLNAKIKLSVGKPRRI